MKRVLQIAAEFSRDIRVCKAYWTGWQVEHKSALQKKSVASETAHPHAPTSNVVGVMTCFRQE